METIRNQETLTYEDFETIRKQGALLIPDFVDTYLADEILLSAPLENLQEVYEPEARVRHGYESVSCYYPDRAPEPVQKLGKRVTHLTHAQLPEWLPNYATIQRYRPENVGIERHRDSYRFILLVAVVTVAGSADFHVELDNDNGDKTWETVALKAGDLVLMRAPFLNGDIDDRPYHRIDPPQAGERISVAYRQNVRLDPSDVDRGETSDGNPDNNRQLYPAAA